MILTPENYHSPEMNRVYMSVSQFKSFLNCEAQALAKVNEDLDEEEKECLKVSSYVHAGIEGPEALEQFKLKHPDIFSSKGPTKGELKSGYRNAETILKTLREDELCSRMLQGEKEVIVTAEMFGVLWKCKIDVLAIEDGRISDLKAIKSIRETFYNPVLGRRESFIEHYGYGMQMAVYSEVERLHSGRSERLEPFIVAASKEGIPDKEVICFDDLSLEAELMKVRESLPRVIAVKEGIEPPKRCGKCPYCRSTKKAEIVHYMSLLEGA